MRVVLAVLACSLAGCISPQQLVENDRRADQQYTGALENRCASYGFRPQTPEMSQCMLQVDQAAKNRAAAAPAPGGNPYYVPPPQQPVTTRCRSAYGDTNCTTR